jgi:hypothetical protein
MAIAIRRCERCFLVTVSSRPAATRRSESGCQAGGFLTIVIEEVFREAQFVGRVTVRGYQRCATPWRNNWQWVSSGWLCNL